MLKRNIKITFRVGKDENERLRKLVKKSGLSQEAYLRHLIHGVIPRDTPPPDYHAMMRELYRIGNNLNQIAQKANAVGAVDVSRYDTAVREFRQAVQTITNAVVLPEKPRE